MGPLCELSFRSTEKTFCQTSRSWQVLILTSVNHERVHALQLGAISGWGLHTCAAISQGQLPLLVESGRQPWTPPDRPVVVTMGGTP